MTALLLDHGLAPGAAAIVRGRGFDVIQMDRWHGTVIADLLEWLYIRSSFETA